MLLPRIAARSRGCQTLVLAMLAICLGGAAGCQSLTTGSSAPLPTGVSSSFEPSNFRDWSPDMAVLASAEFQGSKVEVRNIRNCRYESEEEYVLDYYDRTFDLDEIEAVDFMVIPFPDQPRLAHTMLSFGFAGDKYVCVSVETRREKGETYDPFRGLVNQYELMYVVGDEHDLVKLRTNYRKNQVYLYRSKATPEQARRLFVDVMQRVNKLRAQPEFYNTLTNNCTTNVQQHINTLKSGAVPFSLDVLMPGSADQYAYNLGLLDTTLPFAQARDAAHINKLAARHADEPNFSALIRRETLAASSRAPLR